jgi:hydrogenase nickel incorporation protein HypA/HybF
MHELTVTQNILDIVLRHANQENAGHVSDVNLVIGNLSSIVDDSVQFYWDFVSEGTIAEGARLHFQRIPARLMCQACNHTYSPDENLTCPSCDSSQVRIISGQEFYLESIGIEPKGHEKQAIA